MTRVKSRAKGARAELDAAAIMSIVTTLQWRRSAQACGKWASDIFADKPIGMHVEVKHYADGLTWWVKRAQRNILNLGGHGLYYSQLQHLRVNADRLELATPSPTCKMVEEWMAQAVRDAGDHVPVVLCRQNNSPWLFVWRVEDDDRLWDALQEHLR